MRWLRGFFSSDDPIVKFVAALNETEAQMRREILEREGVPAMVRNVEGDTSAYGAAPLYGFALFVKQSDAERAEEILGPLMDTAQAEAERFEGPDGQSNG